MTGLAPLIHQRCDGRPFMVEHYYPRGCRSLHGVNLLRSLCSYQIWHDNFAPREEFFTGRPHSHLSWRALEDSGCPPSSWAARSLTVLWLDMRIEKNKVRQTTTLYFLSWRRSLMVLAITLSNCGWKRYTPPSTPTVTVGLSTRRITAAIPTIARTQRGLPVHRRQLHHTLAR